MSRSFRAKHQIANSESVRERASKLQRNSKFQYPKNAPPALYWSFRKACIAFTSRLSIGIPTR